MGSSLTQAEAASLGIKLRESCDACLTAKVKCGKGRPLCARCLQNGSECSYSPSARAGRKNRNSTGGVKKSGSNTASHKRPASLQLQLSKNAPLPSSTTPWASQTPSQDTRPQVHDQTSSNNANSTVAMDISTSATQFHNMPTLTSDEGLSDLNTGLYGIPITPDTEDSHDSLHPLIPTSPANPTEFSHEFPYLDGGLPPSSTISYPDFALSSPSNHIHQTLHTDAWMNQDPAFNSIQPLVHGNLDTAFFQLQSPSQPPSQPSLKPHIRNHINGQTRMQHEHIPAGACDCFADCLQSLKDLHISSWSKSAGPQSSPQFDGVLAVNNTAITASNRMLTCGTCSAKGSIGISNMLMATLFGKVLSLYRTAVQGRFGASRDIQIPASLAFGAYEVSGDDRHLLEIEILLFELKKVEKTMSLWREMSQNLNKDKDVTSVYEALAMYLDKSLSYVTDFLRQRRSEMCR